MAEKATPPETRTITSTLELREDGAAAPRLSGYAATFRQQYDLGAFREQIDPAAFNRTLGSNPDVRLLIDHGGQPLARTKSGTLRLSTDETGLRVDADLDPTDPDVQRLLPKMRRGDLDQMSFAFRVPDGGDSWAEDYTLRTLRECNLSGGDVSVVTYPANPATSVTVRALDELTARTVFVETLMREHRAGKAISADNMKRLRAVLDSLATADDALDAAEASLAEVIGVPNPDSDAQDEAAESAGTAQANSLPLGLSLRIAAALAL